MDLVSSPCLKVMMAGRTCDRRVAIGPFIEDVFPFYYQQRKLCSAPIPSGSDLGDFGSPGIISFAENRKYLYIELAGTEL